MSYQERTNAVSLVSNLLILAFYGVNLWQMVQAGSVSSEGVFRLWGTIIILSIVMNIAFTVITQVAATVISVIETGKEEPAIADERDKLIELKGTRNAYVVFGIGVFLSMGTFVLDMPPLVMFNLLILSGFLSQIAADVSRVYLYRWGI
jgi:hypothetical protein